ncbi:MAG: hypothetical protein J6X99_07000 [Bacteroidales bacterium]|nr:hypothetical protein [Bacteroidales bacterium]
MKKYFIVALASVAALALASCVKESSSNMNEEKTPIDSQELITINARIPEGGFTKVDLAEAAYAGAINLTWHEGDKIIVTDADDETNTQEFTLTGGAGTTEGTFTGKVVTADTYIIVYDSIGDEFEFSEQTQAADASTDHLKYKAVLTGVNDYTDFEFSDTWAASAGGTFTSSSVLRVRANLGNLDPADVNAVILKADDNIFAGGKELKINIATPGEDTGEMDFITVYATLPEGDQAITAGTYLVAQFQMSDKAYDKYTVFRELGAGTITGGKVNSFNIDCGENFTKFANKSSDEIGTAANPYLVGDQHQMAEMYYEMKDGATVYFVLVDDIDMTGVDWIPLNYSGSYTKAINFDGKGYWVSNLTVDTNAPEREDPEDPTSEINKDHGYPSFAGVANGTYKDVTFDKASIIGGSNNTGVFAGYIGTTDISATCTGITISNSTLTATATAKTRCAGLFGGKIANDDCVVTDCHVVGTNSIEQTTTEFNGCSVGGFVGEVPNAATITGCTAKADITNAGSYYTGGFIGQIGATVPVRISHCAFLGGTITAGRNAAANSPVGGFIGRIANNAAETAVEITGCYVDGAVISATQSGRVGGFVGEFGRYNRIISSNVKNTTVDAAQHLAGFGGCFYGIAEECYVESTVSVNARSTNNGGFGGYFENASATNCYSSATVNGNANANTGGFIGNLRGNSYVSYCYENGVVNGTGDAKGAFAGLISVKPASVTKNIAWNSDLSFIGTDSAESGDVIVDNYCGTSGTISSQAQTLGWDDTVWDLTGSVPVLK